MRVLPLLVTAVTLVACGGASSSPDATTVSSTATAPSASARSEPHSHHDQGTRTVRSRAVRDCERRPNRVPPGDRSRHEGRRRRHDLGGRRRQGPTGRNGHPERGQCGFEQATDHLEALLMGREVTLSHDGRDDRDRYGRLLRYVDVDGVDAGSRRSRRDSPGPVTTHATATAHIRARPRTWRPTRPALHSADVGRRQPAVPALSGTRPAPSVSEASDDDRATAPAPWTAAPGLWLALETRQHQR